MFSILLHRFRRRQAWLVPLCLGVIGAILSAGGIQTVVEANTLDVGPPAPAAASLAPTITRSKEGGALIERNMFCSSCAPVEQPAGDPEADGGIVFTRLPLELLATSLAAHRADSFATLRNRDTDQQGAYGLGDRVPGAGPLVRINGDYADFENQATGRVERVGLIATVAPPPAPARTAARSTDPFGDRVRATGANRFELDASLVKELIADPTSIRGVRFAPHVEGGQVAGFQLTYAANSSIAAALGLRRGDVVQAVNGLALSSPDA
ncbi:MAG TPA: hypothetical protein VML75_15255, partial [Kofleriaceae bacterium]|nr:hypothetical protein [Kofleriaceae bacterium]